MDRGVCTASKMLEHPDPFSQGEDKTFPRGLSGVTGRGVGPQPQPLAQGPDEQDPDAHREQGWGRRVIDALRCVDVSFEGNFFQMFLFGRLLRNLSLCARHCDRPSAGPGPWMSHCGPGRRQPTSTFREALR